MNRSILIAFSVFSLLSIYMLTGLVGCGKPESAENTVEADVSKPLMSVRTRNMTATAVPREVIVTGKTSPSRTVTLKAETPGAFNYVAEDRGKTVRKDQLIAEVDLDDRPQRLKQAQAALEQTQLEYDSTLRLQDRDLRSSSQVAQALSRLRGAEQLLQMIDLDIEKTRLVAPFDAILHDRYVEEGDYVGIGDPVAYLIDLDPLVITGELTEFQIGLIKIGESGTARLASGQEVEGTIRYVSGEANSITRTFTVELEVSNPDMELPGGVTAEISIETEIVQAYEISPGLISIADDGRFGVKTVDADNRVRFFEADIVSSDPDILWLTGLPETIRLITVGQGFVQPGDIVEVVPETGSNN